MYKAILLCALSAILIACANQKISKPFNQEESGWVLPDRVTHCEANYIEDFSFSLSPAGVWNAEFKLFNSDLRRGHTWRNVLNLAFDNGAGDRHIIPLGTVDIAGNKVRNAQLDGSQASAGRLIEDAGDMLVTLEHECEDLGTE